MSPFFKPVQISLNGIPSFCCTNCATQLGVFKLTEGILNPTLWAAYKDGAEHRLQNGPLENVTHDCSGYRAADCSPPVATI